MKDLNFRTLQNDEESIGYSNQSLNILSICFTSKIKKGIKVNPDEAFLMFLELRDVQLSH